MSFDFFFFQAEDGIRDYKVTGVQTCALPIYWPGGSTWAAKARPSISQVSSGFLCPMTLGGIPGGPGIALGRLGAFRSRTSLAGVASALSPFGPTHTACSDCTLMVLALSFWMTTSTGSTP